MKHESPIGKVLDRLVAADTYLTRLNIVLGAALAGVLFGLALDWWWAQ